MCNVCRGEQICAICQCEAEQILFVCSVRDDKDDAERICILY